MQPLIIDSHTKLLPADSQYGRELFYLVEKNRAHLTLWLPWVQQSTTPAHTLTFLHESEKKWRSMTGLNLLLFKEEKICGVVGLHYFDWSNSRTCLGYWLDEDHQGQGLLTKALTVLFNYLYTNLQLNRIEARCNVTNIRSKNVLLRMHMQEEGILRQVELIDGKFADHYVFGLLKQDWLLQLKT